MAAVDELGFRQNMLARALASRHTRIIALLSPALEHHLGRAGLSIITSAAQTARERGYRLVLWPMSNDAHEMTELVTDGLLDGVLLMEVEFDDARVDKLTELGAKFALIGRTRDPSGLAYVDIDFDKAVADGLEYLVGLGHLHIAMVMGEAAGAHLPGYGPRLRVEDAFRAGMISRGLEPIVTSAEPTRTGGAAAVDELLLRAPQLTAIFVSNEDAAPGIVQRLEELGRPVPAAASVLSIANLPVIGEAPKPILSTLNVPQEGLGELGVAALIDQIEGGSAKNLPQTLLPCVLQIEETTGRAPGPPA
jgi:DNA-binding LacI/PurR family transcriptional regulator